MTSSRRSSETVFPVEKAILAEVCLGISPNGAALPLDEETELDVPLPTPDTFLFHGDRLRRLKFLYRNGDERTAEAVKEFSLSADAALRDGPFSVTDKSALLFSDDPHEYQSLAELWWPNPDTGDGIPYIERDGRVNPDYRRPCFDRERLARFSDTVVLLALAHYVTDRDEYGQRAALLLDTWFTAPGTRQNPRFGLAAHVPGREQPRGEAIVEARRLVYITEAVRLLDGGRTLKPDASRVIRGWFEQLLTWLLESEHGRAAREASADIVSWYVVQGLVYSRFCDRADLIEQFAAAPGTAKIADPATLLAELGIRSGAVSSGGLDPDRLLDAGTMLRAMQLAATTQAAVIDRMREELARSERSRRELKQLLSVANTSSGTLEKENDALVGYADRLESKYRELLESRSWRLTRPLRFVAQITKRWLTGQPSYAGRLPHRPGNDMIRGKKGRAAAGEHLHALRSAEPDDEKRLEKEYRNSGLNAQPDTFALYRIIGNDLVPRQKTGQSRDNLRFILDHEPQLPGCVKYWIVNRIIDPGEERRILELLEAHGQHYVRIPFEAETYRDIDWDFDALPSPGYLAGREFQTLDPRQRNRVTMALYRLKNNYVMNNNGARNAALADGRRRAKWILPWDGNCFITANAWKAISRTVIERPHLRYFVVPMARVTDNHALLDPDYQPEPVDEPQILFRRDASEEFDEAFCYGRRPKVELFWRLGVPGQWDEWRDEPWDLRRPHRSPEARQFGVAGWVARLLSGVRGLEKEGQFNPGHRDLARQQAIVSMIDHVDRLVFQSPEDENGLTCYTTRALKSASASLWYNDHPMKPLAESLAGDAEQPRDDLQCRHAGKTAGLQRMLETTTRLVLAWAVTGRPEPAARAADLVRTWFSDPGSWINPQLSAFHQNEVDSETPGTLVFVLADLHYFLDAVRLLESAGAFGARQKSGLEDWLRRYMQWLETSSDGLGASTAAGGPGIRVDLQVVAMAAYLDDRAKLRDAYLRFLSRITREFTPNGRQAGEPGRRAGRADYLSNLQTCLNLLLAARTHDMPEPVFTREPLRRIAAALEAVMDGSAGVFDRDRVFPLLLAGQRLGLTAGDAPDVFRRADMRRARPVLAPELGVPPYWNLLATDAD